MSKKHQPPVYVSVTIDYLKSLPCLDIDNNPDHLRAALFAVGFDVNNGLETKFGASTLRNTKVRCTDKPYMYRHTTVYAGQMRKDFPYKNIYKDGFLDVAIVEAEDLCINLPFDIPVELKANTRKYTKKSDLEDMPTNEELESLGGDFDIIDSLGAA